MEASRGYALLWDPCELSDMKSPERLRRGCDGDLMARTDAGLLVKTDAAEAAMAEHRCRAPLKDRKGVVWAGLILPTAVVTADAVCE